MWAVFVFVGGGFFIYIGFYISSKYTGPDRTVLCGEKFDKCILNRLFVSCVTYEYACVVWCGVVVAIFSISISFVTVRVSSELRYNMGDLNQNIYIRKIYIQLHAHAHKYMHPGMLPENK